MVLCRLLISFGRRRRASLHPSRRGRRVSWARDSCFVAVVVLLFVVCRSGAAQEGSGPEALDASVSSSRIGVAGSSDHTARTERFLRGRTAVGADARIQAGSAAALTSARPMAISSSANSPTALNAAWQPLGPSHVDSLFYGAISGRVTSIAIDASDPSGNTVYVGTTGGGVWKSTNAASSDPASVSFVPLTDDLPVFAYQQEYTTPSLSIGALSVYNGIILAGTGDPNDASDSYYGSGILRSADGGLTWTLATQAVDSSDSHPSFQGESIAGFAWSTLTPNLVVVAVSQAAEERSGQRGKFDVQLQGPVLLHRCGRDLADVHHHGHRPVDPAVTAFRKRCRRSGRDVGGLEPRSTAFLRGGAISRLLRIGRRHHVDAARSPARKRLEHDCVSELAWDLRQPGLPGLPRCAGGSAGDRRHVRPHNRHGQSRPGALAGCLRISLCPSWLHGQFGELRHATQLGGS